MGRFSFEHSFLFASIFFSRTPIYNEKGIIVPFPTTPRRTSMSHTTPCHGKMAQNLLQKSGKILDVIDFNENFRQVSSLLTLYKFRLVRYNIFRRQDVSPRPLYLLLFGTPSSYSVRYQSYDNPYADSNFGVLLSFTKEVRHVGRQKRGFFVY